MRWILSALLALTMAVSRPSAPQIPQDVVPAVHHISLVSATEGGTCTAEAVGKHTLLTAAHCVIGTDRIVIDGQPAAIKKTVYDGNDHVLIVVIGVEFDSTLKLEERDLRPGERVVLYGFPGTSTVPVYRFGYLDTVESMTGADGIERQLFVFKLPIFPGDSGSALISEDGKIVAIASMGNANAQTACLPLAFAPEQLREMR
jgi:V8-like Glu-specific endopeptidase